MKKAMFRAAYAAIFFLVAIGATGCLPKVMGANAIQPSEPGDTNSVWIYMTTNDPEATGVYRCYDGDQKPVCIRAKIVTK